MMKRLRSSLILVGLVGIAWISPSLAETDAEEAAPSKQATPSGNSASAYDEAELQRFADAALEVVRIKATYAPLLAQKIQEQQEVRQAASEEMEQSVKQHGMSLERYQEILSNVQEDPELAGRVDKHILESVQTQSSQQQPATPSGGDAPRKQKQEI